MSINHQGRLAIVTSHKPTKDACVSVFKLAICQRRYRLKKKYFVGLPPNEIPTTSLVSYMTNAQWSQLVDKWSNMRNRVISLVVI
jgi:hypothetical protein